MKAIHFELSMDLCQHTNLIPKSSVKYGPLESSLDVLVLHFIICIYVYYSFILFHSVVLIIYNTQALILLSPVFNRNATVLII